MPPKTPFVPASPTQRFARAFGSLLLLCALVGGLPVALALLAGNPLPDQWPDLDGVWAALTSPDDGSLFLSLLAVLGWVAWAVFTGTVVLELLSRLTRRATPRIPGLSGPQRLAAVLIAAIATVAITPTVASASAAMVDTSPPSVAAPAAGPLDPSVYNYATSSSAEAESVVHLVERGEGLLDLQEKYGVPWQRIAEANYGVEQPDGRTLQRGQTRIYAGWQLTIPTSGTGAVPTTTPGAEISAPAVLGFGTLPVAAPAIGEPERGDPADEVSAAHHEYEVAQGDWMWHIADRYLGDPHRYQEIAELNPEYGDRNGNFPDHIEPGWTLQLPPDAVDSGATAHATGESAAPTDPDLAAPEQPEEPTDPADPADPDEPDEPEEPGGAAGPADDPDDRAESGAANGLGPADDGGEIDETLAGPAPTASGFGAAPDPEAATEVAAVDEAELDRLAPATLAGAGLLAALVLGAAALLRQHHRQHHRPGFRFATGGAGRLEKALRSAEQPLDTARLNAALQHLATSLTGRAGPLPDIAGAMIDEGSVHLLLGSACPGPPAPWRDHPDRWTLPAGTVLPPIGESGLAPLPTLATIGSQAGIHLLLDLERLGFVAIHGEPTRALDLLRYLAAELACNTWSDHAEVLLAGFEPYEAELLTSVNPYRVRVATSVDAAIGQVRQRLAAARATLSHTGAGDALAGRLGAVAGDSWMPQVLLANATTSADAAALAELSRELTGAARCAVATVTPDPTPVAAGSPQVEVTVDGAVQVRLPFLRASLSAASLPVPQLASLAQTMRAARTTRLVPVPPAAEPESWTLGADAAGAVRGVGRAVVGAAPAPEPVTVGAASSGTGTVPVVLAADADQRLDADVAAWFDEHPLRPRIGVLGPVTVAAGGDPPQTRRRLHTELLVFLAQRAGRGADADLLDNALWPGGQVTAAARQLVISRVRQWLGTDEQGRPWLPDVAADLAYRLADGYLFDWHLFRRLRTRAALRGSAGTADLQTALRLVRGVPLADAQPSATPGLRNPYPWLAESEIYPDHLLAAIVDTAHELAQRCLADGDPAGVRWAVAQTWLADPQRRYDQPWRDLLRAEHADGQTDRLRELLRELLESRDAESLEDLAPETYRLVSTWPRNLLVLTG